MYSLSSYTQKNTMEEKTTKNGYVVQKTKKQLINQANKIISSKYPEFEFDSLLYEITAWKNSVKTTVNYRRIIRFTPLDKKDENLEYDFEVNLTNREVSPFDFKGFEKFYLPTTEDQGKIDFVIKTFDLPRMGFYHDIVESPDMYSIHIYNNVSFGKYFINKITGKESLGYIEGNYALMPEFPELGNEDPLIEIIE